MTGNSTHSLMQRSSGSKAHWNVAAPIYYAMVSDGVLEIECSDGSKIIVNRHDAAQEIWVAARTGGFHYRWDGSCWQDTRHHEELMAALSRIVSQQAGETISLVG